MIAAGPAAPVAETVNEVDATVPVGLPLMTPFVTVTPAGNGDDVDQLNGPVPVGVSVCVDGVPTVSVIVSVAGKPAGMAELS